MGVHSRGRGGAWARAGRVSAAAVAAVEEKRFTTHQSLPKSQFDTATFHAALPLPSAGGEVSIGGNSARRGWADNALVATQGAGAGAIGPSGSPPAKVPIGRGAAFCRRQESVGGWGSHQCQLRLRFHLPALMV